MRRSVSAALLLLSILPLFAACGLVHREKPNEAPRLQAITADTLVVGRGGRVQLAVRASDEDDDPLFYRWDAFGAGAFSDTTCVDRSRLRCDDIIWFAPSVIVGPAELFLISVVIRDRQCDIIPTDEDRARCEEDVGEGMESILIEVVQTPPTVALVSDTTVTLTDGTIAILGRGRDAENDVLEYIWEQTAGEVVEFEIERVDGGSRLAFAPVSAGDYGFRLEVDDDAETATAETVVHVVEEAP